MELMQIGHKQPVLNLSPPVVHEDSLSVALVCMPWAVVDMPSLALSTVAPLFERRGEVEKLDVVYGNIRWLDHLVREVGLERGHYELIVDAEVFGVGEWVFSSCFRPGADPRGTSFYDLIRDSEHLDAYCAMFRAAPAFIDELARDLVASDAGVLGLTTTFDQNIASFALAHRVKELRPDVVTILGGANCDGVQGTAVHRARPEFDYVIRGEAEHSIAPLIAHIAECRSGDGKKDEELLRAVPGLCWRSDADGTTVSNPIGRTPVSMNVVPEPTYDHYFRDLGKSPAAPFIDVKIPLEASRGCWWGAKHHCTFCGLNGSAMTHRAKPAERVRAEAGRAIRRHHVLDLVFSDNILAPEHVVQLTSDLALPAEWDVRLFAEVKSNLNFSQLESLARAGFTQLQPGVESLCTPILRIMRKGVTGWQNVRFLRDCATCRIYPSWNILVGFPGEKDSDYEALIASLPSLHHLTPPAGAFPIKLERFSPYFDDPALGLQALGPSLNLVSAYEGVAEGLDDLVYVFESAPAGLSPEVNELLREAVASWKETGSVSRLVALPSPDGSLVVIDDRPAWPSRELVFRPGLEAEAYRALAKGKTLPALASVMRSLEIDLREGQLEELVENWTEFGIVFREDSTYLALATGLRW